MLSLLQDQAKEVVLEDMRDHFGLLLHFICYNHSLVLGEVLALVAFGIEVDVFY